MKMHWAAKYIGQPWTQESHCYEWFRKITKEQFGIDVPFIDIREDHLTMRAAKIMSAEETDFFGYQQTENPVDGDAVFLSSNKIPHHIGIVIFDGGKRKILHAIKDSGVVVSDNAALKMNNLKIRSFWHYACNPQL